MVTFSREYIEKQSRALRNLDFNRITPMSSPKKKTIKAWAVIWTKESSKIYGVRPWEIISGPEPQEDFKVRMNKPKNGRKYYTTNTLAIFTLKKEAEAYHLGNVDWNVIPCVITYCLQKRRKSV